MKSPRNENALTPAALCRKLFKLERSGKYEEALAEVKYLWPDTRYLPNIEGFEKRDAAEILLRCGSLFGFLGHFKLLSGAQEKSKNLLDHARRHFLDIYDVEKIVECENYIALAYWRTGEFDAANAYIEEALSHDLPFSNRTGLYTLIINNLINFALKRYQENLESFPAWEKFFLNCKDNYLIGEFYNHYAITEKNLGYDAKAVVHYELARHYHSKSGNKIHLGSIENNISLLYKNESNFAQAHTAIDSAINLFNQIKYRAREGFAFETKAQIYFAEAKYAEALHTIEHSVRLLEESENSSYLTEAYLTNAKILLYLDNFSSAVLILTKAVELTKIQLGEGAVNRLVTEFEQHVNEKSALRLITRLEPVLEENSRVAYAGEKIKKEFDVALSFAGEDREFVEEVFNELKKENISVFYDRAEEIEIRLWGRNLATTLGDIYQRHSDYVVVFISKHYATKIWTQHEFKNALAGAFSEKPDYILPARFDDSEIPGLLPTTAFWDLKKETAKTFAQKIIRKLATPLN